MHKIGVQSGGIFSLADHEKGFATLEAHGFECVDLNVDNLLPSKTVKEGEVGGMYAKSVEELIEYFTPLRDSAKKYGIKITQMHGPFPLWVNGRDEDMNPFVLEATKKAIAVADFLDCRNIVVHPINAQYILSKEKEKELNFALYRALMPTAKKYGVTVCLENLFAGVNGRNVEGPCSDVSEACNYIDTLNAEAGEKVFGFCLDIGHSNLYGRNLKEYIIALGDRLSILHIHDNDGAGDLHMIPYSYLRGKSTSIDWNGFVAGLRAINYKGDLCFETFRAMSAYPADTHPQVLDLIHAIGVHFVKELEAE